MHGSIDRPAPTGPLLGLIAAGAGLSAASLYYNQPILGAIAAEYGASPADVGVLPMLTQVGYAAGILLFAPFGDRFDLRRVILVKGSALCIALLVAGFSPSLAAMAVASLAIGLSATTAQDFIPAAAALAPEGARGKIVGRAMTGLLLGILLSRVVSGAVGEHLGWRAVYLGAAGLVAALLAVTAARLPSISKGHPAPYGTMLLSTITLVRQYGQLRRAAFTQALLALAFSGFWSTLAIVLARPPFQLGSSVAGAFGVAGAAGALAASVVGALADRRGPAAIVRFGALLVLVSFLAMALLPGSLVVLVVATIVFDIGVQASLIAHQTIVYGLEASARSRLNAVLVSIMFVGMAFGSAVATRLVERWGLVAVGVLGASAASLAWLVSALSYSSSTQSQTSP